MPESATSPKRGDERLIDLGGTLRTCEAHVTLERAKRLFPIVGITRLANVTGLDTVGVPTWMAVRPLAKSLSVSQGKGVTDDLAKVSAVMEAIEIFHAEEYVPHGEMYPLGFALQDSQFVHPMQLPVRSDAFFSADCSLEWIEGHDLVSTRSRLVPRELVDLDFTKPRPASSIYRSSSNGLASGNSLLEAQLHALCEVIERDQVSFWRVGRDLGAYALPTRMDLESIDDVSCQCLIDRIRTAGLEIAIWNATGQLEVPCFACSIYDARLATLFPQRASGYGSHPYKRIALSRAITEAVQSRLTHISGARDDVYWSRFKIDLPVETEQNQTWLKMLNSESCSCQWSSIQEAKVSPSLGELVQFLLTALARQQMDEVFCFDLAAPDIGVPVVKLVVPGLEFSVQKETYTPGPRMQSFLAGLLI